MGADPAEMLNASSCADLIRVPIVKPSPENCVVNFLIGQTKVCPEGI